MATENNAVPAGRRLDDFLKTLFSFGTFDEFFIV